MDNWFPENSAVKRICHLNLYILIKDNVCSYSTCFFFLGPIITLSVLTCHLVTSLFSFFTSHWCLSEGGSQTKKKYMSFLFVLFGGDHHFQELMVENGCSLQDFILNAGHNITSVQKEKILKIKRRSKVQANVVFTPQILTLIKIGWDFTPKVEIC